MADHNFENEQVLQALGVKDIQSAMEIMNEMTSEFVTEQKDEGKLNNEIEDLLSGIDFQQSLSQNDTSSVSPICITSSPEDIVETSSVSPTCIPSSLQEENNVDMQISSPELFPMEQETTENLLPQYVECTTPGVVFAMEEDISQPEMIVMKDETPAEPVIIPMEHQTSEPILQPFTSSEVKTPENISINAVSIFILNILYH